MFMSADVHRQGGHDRSRLCLAGDLDHLHRKMVELSWLQRKLRWALAKISDARSLAEAQFTLGAKEGVLPSLLAASMREARQSAGISSDAASRSARPRAAPRSCVPRGGGSGSAWACLPPSAPRRLRRPVRHGVGIMNSFIAFRNRRPTNLAVVAPGIAEALLATAIGPRRRDPGRHHLQSLCAGDEGLHRAGERASGAAARLLSRDLDRTHVGGPHSRAAE